MPPDDNGDAFSWSCSACTYLHESSKERHFLKCSICGADKPTTTKSFACAEVSTDASLPVPPLAVSQPRSSISITRPSPGASLSTKGVQNTKKKKKRKIQLVLSPGLHNKDPSRENTNFRGTNNGRSSSDYFIKKKTGGSSVEASSKTNSISFSSKIHNENGDDNDKGMPPKRSILDLLKPCRASSFVPPVRFRESTKEEWRTIALNKVSTLCPMTVIRDALPLQIADTLLEQLEQSSQTWNRGNWIVHGKEHRIPRTTATFHFMKKDNEQDQGHAPARVDDGDEYHDNQRERPITPELRQAAVCIAALVKKHCPWSSTPTNNNDNDMTWEPTFALANRYANGQECVGWHADHITPLGPRPIIVGLSLGACRRFELRQASKSNVKSRCRHISVPLPHNSVAIMWSDAQESWQHCVPRCSDESLLPSSVVGPVRISLTFRRQRQNLPNLGVCYCGRSVGLKAKDGLYYTFCQPYGPDKHKTCSFWKRCSWAEKEAKRLVQLEERVD